MSALTMSAVVWIAVLIAAIPYVNRIRHPAQRPLAAYLIFVFMFVIASAVLYGVLAWLANVLGVTGALNAAVAIIIFLAVVITPAFFLARWLASKPPSHTDVPR